MSSHAGTQQQSVADALARRVEALRELGAVDRAVYEAVADTPTPELDGPVRRLSDAANYSRLWLGIAAVIAVLGGRRGRRAALESVLAIGVTYSDRQSRHETACPTAAPGTRRPRGRLRPARCGCRNPNSFPSGHAASAFAFAYAIGRHLPGLAVPFRLLAGGVMRIGGHSREARTRWARRTSATDQA
jgi:VanZ family protein